MASFMTASMARGFEQMAARNAAGYGAPLARGVGAFNNAAWAGVPPPPPVALGQGESWFRSMAPTVLTIGAVVGSGWLLWHWVGGTVVGAIDSIEGKAAGLWQDLTHADVSKVSRTVEDLAKDVGKVAVGTTVGAAKSVVDTLWVDPLKKATAAADVTKAGAAFRAASEASVSLDFEE